MTLTLCPKKFLNVLIGHRLNEKKLVENRETVFLTSVGAKLFWLLVGAGPDLLNFFKQIRKILKIQIKFLLAGLFFIYNIFNMALKGQCHEFFKSFFGLKDSI